MRNAIYVISKVPHAPMWREYRERGFPIISTWIDDGLEIEIDFSEAWPRYLAEAAQAKYAILFAKPGELLKGGLFEAGAALANGAHVFVVGEVEAIRTLRHHPKVHPALTIPHALSQINQLSGTLLGGHIQREAADWVNDTYGSEYLFDRMERIRRFSEESFELAQVAGLTKEELIRIMDHVYSRPVGELHQEIAGCGSTLMTLAEANGLSFEDVLRQEIDRVKALPVEYFRKKHAVKKAAGISKSPVTFRGEN